MTLTESRSRPTKFVNSIHLRSRQTVRILTENVEQVVGQFLVEKTIRDETFVSQNV
jgi:hypothetical protein